MDEALLDGAAGRHQRLREHLAAEDAVAPIVRALPAKQVEFEILEVEEFQQALQIESQHAAEPTASPALAPLSAAARPGRSRAASRVRGDLLERAWRLP